MARTLGDILRRFRPAVAPGPAAPAGVPADRVAEAEAELAVVFAALAPTVAEATRLVEEATTEAERRRHAAHQEAQRMLGDATARLDAVRSATTTARLAELDASRAALEAATRAEVGRLALVAEECLPGLVAVVIARVWETAGLAPPERVRTGARPEPADHAVVPVEERAT